MCVGGGAQGTGLGMHLRVELLHGGGGDGGAELNVAHGVAGGHDVVVVDVLEERLDLGALDDLLLGHALGHLERGALDAGDEAVAELTVFGAIIEGLDDDGLLAGEAERWRVRCAVVTRGRDGNAIHAHHVPGAYAT